MVNRSWVRLEHGSARSGTAGTAPGRSGGSRAFEKGTKQNLGSALWEADGGQSKRQGELQSEAGLFWDQKALARAHGAADPTGGPPAEPRRFSTLENGF